MKRLKEKSQKESQKYFHNISGNFYVSKLKLSEHYHFKGTVPRSFMWDKYDKIGQTKFRRDDILQKKV
jgi:hypothetical protein